MVEHARPLDGVRVSSLANVHPDGLERLAPPQATPASPQAPVPQIPRVPIPALGLILARAVQDIIVLMGSALVSSQF